MIACWRRCSKLPRRLACPMVSGGLPLYGFLPAFDLGEEFGDLVDEEIDALGEGAAVAVGDEPSEEVVLVFAEEIEAGERAGEEGGEELAVGLDGPLHEAFGLLDEDQALADALGIQLGEDVVVLLAEEFDLLVGGVDGELLGGLAAAGDASHLGEGLGVGGAAVGFAEVLGGEAELILSGVAGGEESAAESEGEEFGGLGELAAGACVVGEDREGGAVELLLSVFGDEPFFLPVSGEVLPDAEHDAVGGGLADAVVLQSLHDEDAVALPLAEVEREG